MQLNAKDKQLNAREYKPILDPNKFAGTDSDKDIVTGIIENQIDKQNNIGFRKTNEKKVKNVWYMDTDDQELHKKNHFTVRVKQKTAGNMNYDVTFKVRHADKKIVTSVDLYTIKHQPAFKLEKQKYEEDIISPFDSIFSVSTELEYKENPNLKTCDDIISIFPNLKLDGLKGKQLVEVNWFKAEETTYKMGEIVTDDAKKAEVEFSLWSVFHLPKDKPKSQGIKSPIIGEFDMDVSVKDLIKTGENDFDVFTDPAISEINDFYNQMQNQDIIGKKNKTKTEYVYNWKK